MRANKIQVMLVAAAAAAITACTAAGGSAIETAADSAAIRALGDKFEAAWNAGDAAALAQLVTEDYHAAEPDGAVLDGRAAYETMAKTEAEPRKGTSMAMDVTPVRTIFLNASTASSNGTWTIKGAPPGTGPDKGSYLVVSVKEADGQWRIRSSLGAAYVPPPATPPVKPK